MITNKRAIDISSITRDIFIVRKELSQMIRRARMEDKKAIMAIIHDVVVDLELKGIHQWDDIYPDEDIINNDLSSGHLYVYTDSGHIRGIIVLNEHQETEYKNIPWKYNWGKQLIVHRLCIDPRFQGQGIARQLMTYAEEYGKGLQYESIRLDSFANNEIACNLYKRLEYAMVGTVRFRKGEFYCYEKRLA